MGTRMGGRKVKEGLDRVERGPYEEWLLVLPVAPTISISDTGI